VGAAAVVVNFIQYLAVVVVLVLGDFGALFAVAPPLVDADELLVLVVLQDAVAVGVAGDGGQPVVLVVAVGGDDTVAGAAGAALPSLDILKKIAVAFSVSTDWLIFEEGEREPQDELKLKFEAVTQMDEDERYVVLSVLDSMILKHQAKRFFVSQTGTR